MRHARAPLEIARDAAQKPDRVEHGLDDGPRGVVELAQIVEAEADGVRDEHRGQGGDEARRIGVRPDRDDLRLRLSETRPFDGGGERIERDLQARARLAEPEVAAERAVRR